MWNDLGMANNTSPAPAARPSAPVAADIYERQEMDERGEGGSVHDDIADMDMDEMFDYFGDLDPIAFL